MTKSDSNVVPLRAVDPLDRHIGGRITIGRRMVDVSQTQIAEKIGVTYQQVQKYESGANRIVAARLFQIADTLNLPVTFFYDGYVPEEETAALADAAKSFRFLDTFASTKEGLRLINAFIRIDDKALRDEVITLTETISIRLAAAGEPPARD